MLKLLLGIVLVYTTLALHFPSDLGLPGLNVTNALVLLTIGVLVVARQPERLDRPLLAMPLLAYFAAMVLAFLVALVARPGDLLADVTYLKTTLFYPLYYFVFYYGVRSSRTAVALVLVVLAVALLAAAEAWTQALGYGIGSYVEAHRASGPFGEDASSANRAGVFYAMFVPVFAGIALRMRHSRAWRVFGLLGLAVALGAVVFTYSRQAYAITLVALAILAFRHGVRGVAALLVVCVLGVGLLPQGASERVRSTQQVGDFGITEYDESAASRLEIWRGAVEMWSAHPMGAGHNRFKSMIGEFSAYSGIDAHNYFVLTLAEAGLPGVLALLWVLVALWRLGQWMCEWAVDSQVHALGWVFQVMVVCMVLGNLYGSPFREGAIMGVFWALAAIIERLVQLRHAEAMADGEREPDAGEAGWSGDADTLPDRASA